MFKTNPDIIKGFWTDMKTGILFFPPVIVLLVCAIIFVGADSVVDSLSTIRNFLVGGMSVVLIILGTMSVSNGIVREQTDNTWTFLKLSALTSWDMTIGKLFGSLWYIFYICIVILSFLLFTFFVDFNFSLLFSYIRLIIVVFLSALLIYEIILMLRILGLRYNINNSLFVNFIFIILILFAFSNISRFSFQILDPQSISEFTIPYYGGIIGLDYFVMFSLLVFVIFGFIGLNRAFRRVLNYKSYPIIWLAYLLFIGLYLNGFYQDSLNIGILGGFLVVGIVAYAVHTYLFFIIDYVNIVELKRLIISLYQKDIKKFFINQPLFIVPFILLLIVVVLFLIIVSFFADPIFDKEFLSFVNYGFIGVSLFLFILRDFGLILYLISSRKVTSGTLIFLFVLLYVLIPWILTVGESVEFLPFFYPIGNKSLLISVVPVLVQAFITNFLLFRYIKKNNYFLD